MIRFGYGTWLQGRRCGCSEEINLNSTRITLMRRMVTDLEHYYTVTLIWLFFASNGQPFVTKEERTTKGVIYREDN
ncbi:hypothetical protein KKG56_03440 [bacterium]|nr:hypothetical protein [bacterium]